MELNVKTDSKRGAKPEDRQQPEKEFARIKEGIKEHQAKIAENLRQRVGSGDWKLAEVDCQLDGGKEKLDLVFSAPDGKKEKYIIIDISVPHLGVGQKYGLPGKAKLFQKEREVSALRIKKAIFLIRKGTESISTQPGRIRCPIIEIQLESIVKPEPPVEKRPAATAQPERTERAERGGESNRNRREPARESRTQPAGVPHEIPAAQEQRPGTGIAGVSQDLLFALKEAIVHECLSTMHKRCNKYIRKGLWRWIEREIMDPNVHFYLIILSSIYQGKTGEILSRRFKNVEDYSAKPEEVISAIFSRDNNLADEIKKDSERHRRALTKFLVCFSQTPPFEYLKSVFLKDFRSFNDGLRARMSVYSTLEQLLERCGFEGEKETKYPLEILDELKIFQGIMTGNYATLRTDNAAKKLKHLVPQVEWSNEDIYSLRNQLAKALNLPAQEFNLNAFLPQAFFQDARVMAETRKEAIRLPSQPASKQPAPVTTSAQEPEKATFEQRSEPADEGRPIEQRSSRRDRKAEFFERRKAEKLARQQNRQNSTEAAALPATGNIAEAGEQDSASRPISVKSMIENQGGAEPVVDQPMREPRLHSQDCDEAKHRYFENFGGHLEEDSDAIRLALAMVRHEQEKAEEKAAKIAKPAFSEETDEFGENEDTYRPPLKSMPGRAPTSVNPPPRRPLRPQTPDGQPPSSNRPDRKRRFSRNGQNRNRPRRPGNPGVNR